MLEVRDLRVGRDCVTLSFHRLKDRVVASVHPSSDSLRVRVTV